MTDGRTHMPAGKFSAIIRKVADHVRLELVAKLTFEVSDGMRPMGLYCASTPRLVGGNLEVSFTARLASCKPRDRWLSLQTTDGRSTTSNTEGCCS